MTDVNIGGAVKTFFTSQRIQVVLRKLSGDKLSKPFLDALDNTNIQGMYVMCLLMLANHPFEMFIFQHFHYLNFFSILDYFEVRDRNTALFNIL